MSGFKRFFVPLLVVGLAFGLMGCPNGNDNVSADVNVAFLNAVADGSATTGTTALTLTFGQAISGLSANDFTFSGATGARPGVLSGNGPNYNLTITGVTQGGTLTVAVSRPGYVITGSPRQVTIFHVGGTGDGDGTGSGNDTGDFGQFARFFDRAHNGNNTGSTIVANNSHFDMLLFRGESLVQGNIVAGIRGGDTAARINLSGETDYAVGGWTVLRAVRLSVFENDGPQSRVDHSVMATFRQGTETRVEIVSTTDGDFRFIVHNMSSQFALQLRENSPTGRVIAFLTRGEQNRIINTPNAEQIMLHPTWVGFSTQTMSTVTFAPTDNWTSQPAIPSQGTTGTHNVHFPFVQGSPIEFPVRAPAAIIRVQNNFIGAVNFRTATTPHHAIDAPVTVLGTGIIPGGWRSFSMETPATTGLALNIFMQGGNMEVPVRFAGETTMQVIEAGYYYLITFRHITGQPLASASSFEAVISRTGEIDTSGVIQAP